MAHISLFNILPFGKADISTRALVNVSSAAAHMSPSYDHAVYAASKASFAHVAQHLADEVSVERCQIISCHPGRIFTDGAKAAGYTEDSIPWDSGRLCNTTLLGSLRQLLMKSVELPAAYCVWASTPQASFLHGKFVWIDELLGMMEKFEDPGFLKFGL